MSRARSYTLKGSYGVFRGTKIYYTGFAARPKFLPESGYGFAGLKHLLELLKKRLKKFTLTIVADEKSLLKKSGSTYKVRLSAKAITKMKSQRFVHNREVQLRLGQQTLHELFPSIFKKAHFHSYQKGMFAEILSADFDPRLLDISDKQALTRAMTKDFGGATAVDISEAYKQSRDTQLIGLEKLILQFEKELNKSHAESWWQTYFSTRILFFQDSYIQKLEKQNVSIVNTKFPDFMVVTSDGYIDVIEIKTPETVLLNEDKSRSNFYWAPEISKAISQVENYIDSITKHSDAIRNKLRDVHSIDFRIIKPRGIVIAGKAETFGSNIKKGDDFRLLNEALKNVEIVPYDELAQRLRNTKTSLEKLTEAMTAKKSRKRP